MSTTGMRLRLGLGLMVSWVAAVGAACSEGTAGGPAPEDGRGTGRAENQGTAGGATGSRVSEGMAAPTLQGFGDGVEGFGDVPGGDNSETTGIPECERNCQDFPVQPILAGLNPPDPAVFAQPVAPGGGPCILEPQAGVLLPSNWTRPRVNVIDPEADQFQITFSTPREANALVVYTREMPWILPTEIWDGLRRSVFEEDITVTVRSSSAGAPPRESTSRFRIAPVPAGGSIVFWASRSQYFANTTRLLGFSPGAEAVISTLSPNQVQGTILDDNPRPKRAVGAQQPLDPVGVPEGQVRCVGCHTSTPDGDAVAITDHWPWNSKISSISGQVGSIPDYVSPMGDFLLQMPWQGTTTFSGGDWEAGRRRVITSFEGRQATQAGFMLQQGQAIGALWSRNLGARGELAWIDLQTEGIVPERGDVGPNGQVIQYDQAVAQAMLQAKGSGWDVLPRAGDTRSALTPDWSHDGLRVAYTSTNSIIDGHLGAATEADIFVVPFAASAGGSPAGGAATPVAGASRPDAFEYYPDFSADDAFIAFNRVQGACDPTNPNHMNGQIYYCPAGEIDVVPAAGGDAVRLAANDPPACSGETSPGVTNSWAKWSPVVRSSAPGLPYSGRRYYFLTFASTRQSPFNVAQQGGNGQAIRASQLYVTAVVQNPDGSIETYPGHYLWNQNFLTEDGSTVTDVPQSNLTPAWDEFFVPPISVVIQ